MRIAAISEVAEEWGRAVRRWHTMNRKYTSQIEGETAPDRNEEYLLYQTLLGCWPLEDHNNRGVFIARIKDYMQKALREAKINSSWLEPNEAWENATYLFIEKILSDASSNRFPRTIAPLAATVAQLGAINGLAQTVLKLTSPGVPDFYQGTEIWDLSLVDPDNRRPVNYKLRAELLGDLSNPDLRDLLENWKDGRIKMFTISRLLQARRERSELFTGSYEALFAEGDFSDHVVAFARNSDAGRLLVVVPRHTARVGFPPIGTSWGDTRLKNPAQKWRNLFTGQTIGGEWLALSELMAEIPFAVLISTVD